MAELCKFDELRSKTEKQLRQVVNNALDFGIKEARQALKSASARAGAKDHYLKAKRAYAEALRLIPLIDELTERERCSWDVRLEHLREMLEGLSTLGSTRTPAGDNIPALVRA